MLLKIRFVWPMIDGNTILTRPIHGLAVSIPTVCLHMSEGKYQWAETLWKYGALFITTPPLTSKLSAIDMQATNIVA
jgi:hypothetical protein